MYSIRNYGEMILDAPRMQAYENALRLSVKPGCIVADIGTGTGIFALLACRLGARRVYAVEPSEAISIARETAAANGFSDRIEFFQALSTDVVFPERADVIVSDLRGILPFFRRHLPAMADARTRLLAPGGTMIPGQDELWLSVIESDEMHQRVTRPWQDNAFGFDMSAAARVLTNNFSRVRAVPEQLVSAPQRITTLDFTSLQDFDMRADARFVAERAATAHGLCAWFDSTLAPGIRLSNAPGEPALIYGNAFFPWPDAVHIEKADSIAVRMRADLVGDEYVWTWNCDISSADGRVKARFRQSDFLGEIVSPTALRKRAASHVPVLSAHGEIERVALDAMQGRLSVADIARELATRFPERFTRLEEALAYVGDVAARFSR